MGLERLELVIAIEDRFQTRLTDSEAEQIQTVGELYKFLRVRIQKHHAGRCTTASMFYAIRQILETDFSVTRAVIRPNSMLDDLLPQTKRSRFWRTVQRQVSGDLPGLIRSTRLQWHRDQFPETLRTVGDLARECCDLTTITPEFSIDNGALIWHEICRITSEVADVNPELLTPKTSFRRDLGF